MAIFSVQGDRLIRRQEAEVVWIEPWGANSLRVRATQMAEMPAEDWALLPQAERKADIRVEGQTASITNGNITARFSEGGALSFYGVGGKKLLEEQWYTRDPGHTQMSSLEIKAREYMPIIGGDYAITMRMEPNPGEKIFGMGQYQDGCLDKKGCELELAHRNSQASVPFYVSTEGYGFLWNNPAVGRVTFAKNKTVWVARSAKKLDYWITASEDPAEIMSAYADATGHAPMMPDYAMGFWQCKLRYRTQDELLAVAREHKRRGLPMSVIVCDFFHWPYQGDWRFDDEEWPDPEAMVKELKELCIELMVSIWPYVDTRSENYAEMKERGLLARVERGMPYSTDFCGMNIPYDPTNPEARAYIWEKVKKNYYDKGIRIFWLDEAEPECKVYDFDLYRYSIGPVLQVGNIYPVVYAQSFYEGMQAAGQENPLNLLRCAWAGSQRFGALVWSGDIDTKFRTLREQCAAGLSMAMAGIPWWTTDIGGFHGGDQNDPAFRELLVRWFQFGAVCPVFRLHGFRATGEESPNPAKAGTGGPNEVWSYGEEVYEILKRYLFLREEMLPYVEKTMRVTHETGAPVMRPLFYDFPKDAKAADIEDEYMFGDSVLVAPVMELGLRSRDVYLPEGETWVEAHTGAEYAGGQTVCADAPLEVIPVFLRKGADVAVRI